MESKPSPLLILGDVLLRAFLLFGLIGIPLFFTEYFGWWNAEGWVATVLFVWLFIYGIGLFLLAFMMMIAAIIIPAVIVDLWFSLSLACLGSRSAMKHYRETCSRVRVILVGIIEPIKNISFPIENYDDQGNDD